MSADEKTQSTPAPESWTKMSPKDQYAAQEAAEYDPYDIETLANEPN